jgi:hypothetical protein
MSSIPSARYEVLTAAYKPQSFLYWIPAYVTSLIHGLRICHALSYLNCLFAFYDPCSCPCIHPVTSLVQVTLCHARGSNLCAERGSYSERKPLQNWRVLNVASLHTAVSTILRHFTYSKFQCNILLITYNAETISKDSIWKQSTQTMIRSHRNNRCSYHPVWRVNEQWTGCIC